MNPGSPIYSSGRFSAMSPITVFSTPSNIQNKKGLIQNNQKRFLVKVFTAGKKVVGKVFKTF
ncbi:hypothetical protein C5S53_00870 [Methanophagales archaeon]|nr:hypothetical protein C5S53_00870 [Methanophagales archaeon]